MLIALLSHLFSFSASACAPEPLRLTTPASALAPAPVVQFTLERSTLIAQFHVTSGDVYGKSMLGPHEYPYQFDVVEVFVSVEGSLPYYEFELTPFGQTLEVRVQDPHKPFEAGLHLGVETRIETVSDGWNAEFRIPLERLGWKGDPSRIVGNAFAILGAKSHRRYYSRSLPSQAKPSFHRPEFFRSLVPCSIRP